MATASAFPPVAPDFFQARGYRQAMLTGQTRLNGRPIVTRATHQDGSKVYVELAFGLLRDPQHGALGAIATGRVASKPPPSKRSSGRVRRPS